jgi:hypothetical protein
VKSSTGFGLVLLSVILALYFGAAFAEQSYDKANATEPLNLTNATRNLSESAGAPFGIADGWSNKMASSIDRLGLGVSAEISKAHPPQMTTFVIKGTLTRIVNASRMDQSSLNAAILKHGVEETPHGHLTYYN